MRVALVIIGFLGLCWVLTPPIAILASPPSDYQPLPMSELETRCFEEPRFAFCIHETKGSTSPDVLYHFHGRRGSATWWNDSTYYSGGVHKAWRAMGKEAPAVIGISFGPLWTLTDDELMPLFTTIVIPRVERELGREPVDRALVGESMGGFNALLVGLTDRERFNRVAALCPPLPPVSPYASYSEMASYVRRSSTSVLRAALLLSFGRTFFKDAAAWRRNDPMTLARSSPPSKPLYLACGKNDAWGCFEGAEAVVATLRERNAAIEWHPSDGGHCDVDAQSLAEFLARRATAAP